jgi:hypothetical protein
MPLRAEAGEDARLAVVDRNILLVMVPGMSMQAADFHANGLIAAVEQRDWPVVIATVDPGVDAYLDGSVEARLLDGIGEAQRSAGASRIWLAGISLGCQAILRCVRARPGIAEGLMLLTPYLASTGLIAEIGRAGGLRSWAAASTGRDEPDRALLAWLAATPVSGLPEMLVGRAHGDRFATTATMLADLVPADRVISVAGQHDWGSWGLLWRRMLDRDPFGQHPTAVS